MLQHFELSVFPTEIRIVYESNLKNVWKKLNLPDKKLQDTFYIAV